MKNIKGKNNYFWKEKSIGTYGALHKWIRRRLSKPKLCNDCKNDKPRDLANISGKYKQELSDWEWLCRKCHMKKDGRLKKLSELEKDYKGIKNPNYKNGRYIYKQPKWRKHKPQMIRCNNNKCKKLFKIYFCRIKQHNYCSKSCAATINNKYRVIYNYD